MGIQITDRQHEIVQIVKEYEPITSQEIAEKIGLTRAALRPDLSILTMANILEAKPRVGYYLIQEPDNHIQIESLKEIPIKDFQSHPVVVEENMSVYNVIVNLFLEDVGTIFVNDAEGYLVGVVSRKDLLKVTIGEADIRQLPVSVVMSRMPNIITVHPTDSFYVAASKLVNYKIDALPVIVEEELEGTVRWKVVGRFSKTNLAKAIVKQFS